MDERSYEAISDAGTVAVSKFICRLQEAKAQGLPKVRNVPKISIIMPSYNQARYLERTILSVLNQGYHSLDFIIIDGGSTDGSVEIIKAYESYLAYWHSGPDAGQSDALNHGFSKATGDIFGWMNSDDLYLPGAFDRVVEAFCVRPEAGVIFGDWFEIGSDDEVLSVNYAFDFNLGHFIHEGFHLNSQAMFWRSEVHRRFGQFDVKLHRTMDYDLILRLGEAEGQAAFKRIPQPLACFRRHAAQKTQEYDNRVAEEHLWIVDKNELRWKFTLIGKLARTFYRFRRAYWYWKRGGTRYLIERTQGSRMIRSCLGKLLSRTH